MTYQFNLEWQDLPEELREELIDKYLEAGDGYPCDHCDGTGEIKTEGEVNGIQTSLTEQCSECEGKGMVKDKDNLHHRDEAEMDIEARFPIYF